MSNAERSGGGGENRTRFSSAAAAACLSVGKVHLRGTESRRRRRLAADFDFERGEVTQKISLLMGSRGGIGGGEGREGGREFLLFPPERGEFLAKKERKTINLGVHSLALVLFIAQV